MSISNISDPLQSYQKFSADEAKPTDSKINTLPNGDKEVYGVKLNPETGKIVQQASIVANLFSNADTAVSDSLRLTYQAAISKLNDILTPDLGKNSINQKLLDEKGIENWSPKNTADRIISGASGFLEAFKKAHPELEGEALLDKFDEVIGGGLRKGFEEAASILKDMKVFDGAIKDNFNKTVDLVNQGMLDHRNAYLGITPDAKGTEKPTDKTAETII